MNNFFLNVNFASLFYEHQRSIGVFKIVKSQLARLLFANEHDLSNIFAAGPRLRAQQPAHSVHLGFELGLVQK